MPPASAPPLTAPLADGAPMWQPEPTDALSALNQDNQFALQRLPMHIGSAASASDAPSSDETLQPDPHAFIEHTNSQLEKLANDIERVFTVQDCKLRGIRHGMKDSDQTNM